MTVKFREFVLTSEYEKVKVDDDDIRIGKQQKCWKDDDDASAAAAAVLFIF